MQQQQQQPAGKPSTNNFWRCLQQSPGTQFTLSLRSVVTASALAPPSPLESLESTCILIRVYASYQLLAAICCDLEMYTLQWEWPRKQQTHTHTHTHKLRRMWQTAVSWRYYVSNVTISKIEFPDCATIKNCGWETFVGIGIWRLANHCPNWTAYRPNGSA